MADSEMYGSWRRWLGALPFAVAIYIGLGMTLYQGDDLTDIAVMAFGAVAILTPPLMERILKLRLPWALQAGYGAFLVLTLLVGHLMGMYWLWWPWDKVMHLISGLLIGWFGVLLLQKARTLWQINVPAGMQVWLVFMFAATVALLWEVVEYAMDSWFGTTLQRDGLDGTMQDMIYGTFAALPVAIGYALQQSRLRRH